MRNGDTSSDTKATSTGRPDTIDTETTRSLLQVEGAKLGYRLSSGFHLAVKDVSFDIERGQSVMLLGPSGCGKSTLLKAIAGFLRLEDGQILVDGRSSPMPGPDRAVVFQEFDQLFPWRTVMGNVEYPLRRNGRSKTESIEVANHYLEMMGLVEAANRYPHQLSGGMKQRVAIARALALSPLMLLMDEPFGSLDALTRSRLQTELVDIVKRTGVTVLFVTHSIEEAIVLGDSIVVLSAPPSNVREVVAVTPEAKRPESSERIGLRMALRGLLDLEEEEGQHGASTVD